MAAEDWQGMFRKKGWWDGKKITAPSGYVLHIVFLGGELYLHPADSTVPSVYRGANADNTFIGVLRGKEGNQHFELYLWADILKVSYDPA